MCRLKIRNLKHLWGARRVLDIGREVLWNRRSHHSTGRLYKHVFLFEFSRSLRPLRALRLGCSSNHTINEFKAQQGGHPYPHFCRNMRGSNISEPRQRRGESAAPRETTRDWPFHGMGGAAGLPPLNAEIRLVSPMKAERPAGAFANRGAVPAPNPSSHSKNKDQKCRWARGSDL